MFHPVSHTVSISADISMHLVKSINNVCDQIVLLYMKLRQSTLVQCNVIDCHFVSVICGYTFYTFAGLVFQVGD